MPPAKINRDGTIARCARRKTFGRAALQIVAADVSMSLDNVLAVAGAAREHPIVLSRAETHHQHGVYPPRVTASENSGASAEGLFRLAASYTGHHEYQ
jgi:Integral membrane protein TerC family